MFISGTDEKTVVNAFINGASSLVGVSLIIGLARGINLIMEEEMCIRDSIWEPRMRTRSGASAAPRCMERPGANEHIT